MSPSGRTCRSAVSSSSAPSSSVSRSSKARALRSVAERLVHAVARDHVARDVGRASQVVGGAGREDAEHQLLRSAAAQQHRDLVLQFLARHQVAVLGGALHRVAERPDAAWNDRHLVHHVGAGQRAREQRVAHLVIGDGLEPRSARAPPELANRERGTAGRHARCRPFGLPLGSFGQGGTTRRRPWPGRQGIPPLNGLSTARAWHHRGRSLMPHGCTVTLDRPLTCQHRRDVASRDGPGSANDRRRQASTLPAIDAGLAFHVPGSVDADLHR